MEEIYLINFFDLAPQWEQITEQLNVLEVTENLSQK